MNVVICARLLTKRFSFNSTLSLFLFLLFCFTFTTNVNAVQQEWMMQIVNGNETIAVQAHIMLYRGSNLIDNGYSASTWLFNPSLTDYKANFGCDVNATFDSGDDEFTNPTPTWGIKRPGDYLIRIIYGNNIDKYFYLHIPEMDVLPDTLILPKIMAMDADFNIRVNLSTNAISFIYNERGCSVDQPVLRNWVNLHITLKNSFNTVGVMDVDYGRISIPITGKPYNWETNNFPHTATAIDQQIADNTGNFIRRFENWTGLNYFNTNRTITFTSNSASGDYTANFSREFNLSFENKFVGLSNTGTMNIRGLTVSLPTSTYQVKESNTIQATAQWQVINGIAYTFSYWTDGTTTWYSSSNIFSPDNHKTYKAYFIGKPINTYRNLHFYWSNPSDPITVLWSEHPNTSVTKYQIWRKLKYKKGVTGDPVLIGTVNRGTTSFVDQEYSGTSLGFTNYMLFYDVKAYDSMDYTYSDDDYVIVFSDGMLAKKAEIINKNILAVEENSIENYPNPFNPSTIIQYNLSKAGHVNLKVYDCLGNEVTVLVDRLQEAGIHEVSFNAGDLASGLYIYRINANGFSAIKKMILTK